MAGRRSTLRIGTLAGVPIGVQPLWLAIVALITFSLGHDWFPQADHSLSTTAAYALGLASALGLFAGILATSSATPSSRGAADCRSTRSTCGCWVACRASTASRTRPATSCASRWPARRSPP
ncbi:hypothetical protein FSW04_21145 [Baekduia soli]|uniref:Uncharacterized protein n=1 Tax=Baekduia soli TaxID=496014 RepID=A0A5B8U9H2_9ACTN|nr:hypothetical protein [Baekduia soli]QEC49823.1 hypothetical protein FSW04_21145 [Baekduia soli]